MRASVWGGIPGSVMKVKAVAWAFGLPRRGPALSRRAQRRPIPVHAVAGFELERACCDPKDGELCPSRAKPEETLVEARSGSDVQIDRQTWV